MSGAKETITINVNVEITAAALKAVVENAKKIEGRDESGVYRIDTADKVSEMISRFLLDKDFDNYAKGSRKNNFTFQAPIHPARQCCENLAYTGYACLFAPCRTGA